MTSLKFLYFTLIFTTFAVHSQDTNIVKYFPLNVGNVWVYNGNASVYSQCNRTFYHKIYIDTSITINNKTYFRFITLSKHIGGTGGCGYSFLYDGYYYRVDSTNGNIYCYFPNTSCSYSPNEVLWDSLKSGSGDTANQCSNGNYYIKILTDTNAYQFVSYNKPSKRFLGGNFFEHFYFNRYAKDIGLVSYDEVAMSVSSHATLKGCTVNGITYGDTNFYLVAINQTLSEVPESFKLYQNYPNPFNPVTQINFEIPKFSFVNITVYDVLGVEIDILVNEKLSSGTYTAEWNASNYPSGVYFYKLKAGEFTETKKMVVIK